MNTYISWAIFLAVLGGLGWYYAGRPNLLSGFSSQNLSQASSQRGSRASTRKPRASSKRVGRVDNLNNENNGAHSLSAAGSNVSKKRKIAAPQLISTANASMSSRGEVLKQNAMISKEDEDVSNNTNFAKEMAIARVGTQLTASGKPDMDKRQRRFQKPGDIRPHNETGSSSLSTGASSTTGADADDDFSPIASPPLVATNTATTSKSGDISDMLEPAVTGPSVLRLTDAANPVSQVRAKQPTKAFVPAETKKQRQQRIKREAHRAQVEEAEKERRRILEKQIRGARMAEGNSSQIRTSAFKPAAENAWLSRPSHSSTATVETPLVGSPSLLDTFEPNSEPATYAPTEADIGRLALVTNRKASISKGRTSAKAEEDAVGDRRANAAATLGEDGREWAKDLLVEEEQIQVTRDREDSWTTVSKRNKKKASRLHEGKQNDTSEGSGADSRDANGIASESAASSRHGPPSSSNSYHHLGDSAFQDSDWAA